MTENDRLHDVLADLDKASATIDRLRAQVLADIAENYPPAPAGGLLRWTMRHSNPGRAYTYAAVRIGEKWYRTGSRAPRNGETWRELVDFIRSGERGEVLAIVTEKGERLEMTPLAPCAGSTLALFSPIQVLDV